MHLDLDIRNYYEQLVINYVTENKLDQKYPADFISDLCCLALSNLPSRYIRHNVDMAFYLTDQQRDEMNREAVKAVNEACEYLFSKNAAS